MNVILKHFRVSMVAAEKQLSIIYSMCVFVALVSQHAKAHVPYYIAICELSGSTIFSTLPQTRHNFGGNKKIIEHNTCVLIISVINQLDVQSFCFTVSLFHASKCYEHMCSSSEGQNCIIQPLVSSHL